MSEEKVLSPQEKYLNHYVEILKQTLQQQVLNGISLQASAKVNNDVLVEWQKENEFLNQQLEEINSKGLQSQNDLKEQIEKLKIDVASAQSARQQQLSAEIENLKNLLKNKDADILNLRAEIQKVNQLSHEYEKVKHQVQHLETFKSELVKSREETQNNRNEYEKQIKLLNDKIEYLQLTPAKRKKVGQTATVTDKPKATIIKQDLPGMVVKDGGKF